ncbi:sugar isomerase domain-containing protein [Aliivibrio sp. S4TY2]|uniref:sugar isomerase domain-containing protein n=1 Tax=unclassified Aliivibrio TaxID=2645654 RepID=UPI00237883B6|nr:MULTISPECIES: sugar isomerase domain-containing protein [unclassified Aliivibrio]MDD9156882.1 sugar isomerase domain-containing protein [Aliivibrio sp. S4TY2]MDD9160904.1 sugar isomerase domain-containing protein [Aliivibrio sp. S4TY1]MDD9164934.1 sugar isomerase domain-containing protein [Aliivibrio sp. S4MY2]MDD9168791.1 sugar isomerase domain-containing protein [Aliivibrio sp. S4MY4]MDD9185320.1 sugar isomerase domain-containing protein [Aliivibrio sp. S4MY3]
MFEYSNKLIHALEQLFIDNQQPIQQASQLFADAIINDNMIQVLGTGHSHMIGLEGFIRAGGLGNINAILDSTVLTSDGALRGSRLEKLNGLAEILWQDQNIGADDVIVVASNSGRNALPVEFAQLAKDKGHKVIAITSVEQSSQYPSRHESGLKLMDIADIILDNRVPSGDGLCEINNRVTGAFSSISGMALINTLCTEAQKLALEQGVEPLIFSSQNVDGFNNEDVYEHFKGRLKSM